MAGTGYAWFDSWAWSSLAIFGDISSGQFVRFAGPNGLCSLYSHYSASQSYNDGRHGSNPEIVGRSSMGFGCFKVSGYLGRNGPADVTEPYSRLAPVLYCHLRDTINSSSSIHTRLKLFGC